MTCSDPDEKYMKAALLQAEKALAKNEVPIGCVILREGKIIARGYNRRTEAGNVLAHAEIIAIQKACRKLQDWRLEDCTLYVTLEPCPMCAGAIVQARIPRVVIGCMNPKAGCAGSILDLFHEERFNHQVETRTGVLEADCSALMKRFFAVLRKGWKEKKALRRAERLQQEAAAGAITGTAAKAADGAITEPAARKLPAKMKEA